MGSSGQQQNQQHQQQQHHQQQQQQSNQRSNHEQQNDHIIQELKRKPLRKPNDFSAYNYNVRYQSRDYEHSNRQSQYDQFELLEELEELEEETIEDTVNGAKPYIFMALAIVLILVSIALILKTIFCKSDSL